MVWAAQWARIVFSDLGSEWDCTKVSARSQNVMENGNNAARRLSRWLKNVDLTRRAKKISGTGDSQLFFLSLFRFCFSGLFCAELKVLTKTTPTHVRVAFLDVVFCFLVASAENIVCATEFQAGFNCQVVIGDELSSHFSLAAWVSPRKMWPHCITNYESPQTLKVRRRHAQVMIYKHSGIV